MKATATVVHTYIPSSELHEIVFSASVEMLTPHRHTHDGIRSNYGIQSFCRGTETQRIQPLLTVTIQNKIFVLFYPGVCTSGTLSRRVRFSHTIVEKSSCNKNRSKPNKYRRHLWSCNVSNSVEQFNFLGGMVSSL